MTADPIRLIDGADLSDSERALLEAGQRVAPIHYDAVAGAARFRASLVALGAAGAATTAANGARAVTAKSALLGKLATKAILAVALPVVAVGVTAGVYQFVTSDAHRTLPQPATIAAPKPSSAETAPGVAPSSRTDAPLVAPPSPPPLEAEPIRDVPVAAPPAGSTPHPHVGRPHAGATPGQVPNVRVVLQEEDEADTAPNLHAENLVQPPSPSPPAVVPPPASVTSAAPTQPAPVIATRSTPAKSEPAVAVRPSASTEPPPARPPAAPRTADDEIRAMAHARSLLSTNPAEALHALEEIRHDYPKGYFGEERRALTIFALLRTGNRPAALERAKAFVVSYPNGPFTDKVRAAVGLSPP